MSPSSPPPGRARRAPPRRAALALAALAPALAGCAAIDQAVAVSPVPIDYHERHPILLADAPRALDIFVGTGERLDLRQKHDLESFAAEFLAHGEGRIRILVPRGAVDPRAAEATLTAVRRGLAAAGVRGAVEVGAFQAADPHVASALRLSFIELQAGTARPCGAWPEAFGPGDAAFDAANRPYSNLGCASQQTLAAQVDDPRDLVRPRAEEPGDVYMRVRPIKDIRGDSSSQQPQGLDPSTVWTQSALKPIGGGK